MARTPRRAPAFQAPAGETEIAVIERAIAAEATVPGPTRRTRRGAKTIDVSVPAYRLGCTHLGAWVNDAAARQFKAMAMERGVSIREAVIDMLNAEFARRGRPTIAD